MRNLASFRNALKPHPEKAVSDRKDEREVSGTPTVFADSGVDTDVAVSVVETQETSSADDEVDFLTGEDFVASGWDNFEQDFKVVSAFLEGIGQVHPYVKVAVDAFFIAVNTELKRRRNDRRVLVLFVELRDMMLGSSRLKKQKRFLGKVETKLKRLYESTAKFMEEYSSYCEAFQSQPWLVRMLETIAFEHKLAFYSDQIKNQRRKINAYFNELESIKTSSILDRLDAIDLQHEKMNSEISKMNENLTAYLASVRPNQDNDALAFIERSGRAEVASDENLRKALFSHCARTPGDAGDIEVVNLTISLDERLVSSKKHFRMLFNTLNRHFKRSSGSGDDWTEQIAHPDVRNVWEAMGWKLTVRPEELFIALREHYTLLYSSTLVPITASSPVAGCGTSNDDTADDKISNSSAQSDELLEGSILATTEGVTRGVLSTIVAEEGDGDADAGEDTGEDTGEDVDTSEDIDGGLEIPPCIEEPVAPADSATANTGEPDIVINDINGTDEEDCSRDATESADADDGGNDKNEGSEEEELESLELPTTDVSNDAASNKLRFRTGIRPQDAWTLQHMGVRGIRCLSEALDPDASSFVTVAEVNTFTSTCPNEWRLPHLLAYWTSGIPLSIKRYTNHIRLMLRHFLSVHTDNACYKELYDGGRQWVVHVEQCIAGLSLQPFMDTPFDSELYKKFEDHVGKAEHAMTKFLSSIRWTLDSSSTVALLIGDSEIDHRFLMLLCVMSGRIAKVMGQSYIDVEDGAQTKKSEIARLSKSMDVIKEAMFNRLHGLRTVISGQGLNEEQLKHLGHGMYYYLNNPLEFYQSRKGAFVRGMVEASPDSTLYALDPTDIFPISVSNVPGPDLATSLSTPTSKPNAESILHRWTGVYTPDCGDTYSLGRIVLQVASNGALTGPSSWSNIEGDFSLDDARHDEAIDKDVIFTAKSMGKNRSRRRYRYTGKLDESNDRIEGTFEWINRIPDPTPSDAAIEPTSQTSDIEMGSGSTERFVSRGTFSLYRIRTRDGITHPETHPWTYEGLLSHFKDIRDAKQRYMSLYRRCYYYPVLRAFEQSSWSALNPIELEQAEIKDMQAIEFFSEVSQLREFRYLAGEGLVAALAAQIKRYTCSKCNTFVEQDCILLESNLEDAGCSLTCIRCDPHVVDADLYAPPGDNRSTLIQVRRELCRMEHQETRLRAAEISDPAGGFCSAKRNTSTHAIGRKRCFTSGCSNKIQGWFWTCVDCRVPVYSCIQCRRKPMPLESIGTDSDIFKSPHTIGTAQRHLWNHSMTLCDTGIITGHGEDPSPTAPSPDGRNSDEGGSPRDRRTPDFDEDNSPGGYKPARSDPWSSRGNLTEPGISRSSSKRSVVEDVLPEPERRVRQRTR